MINHKLLALFLLAGLFACKQSKTEQLDELLKKTYPAGQPGAAVGIIEKGEVVFERYYGMANLSDSTPIGDSTNFNIASVTKQFTAHSIIMLIRNGKITLDDTLKQFFPQLHPSIANTITIRHLLTHTSGIPDHYSYAKVDSGKNATDLDVLIAVMKMDSLYFPPGTRYRYSNTAYCLLALIIQRVIAFDYRECVRRYIFRELKMDHSDVIAAEISELEYPILHRAMGYSYDSASKRFIQSDARENTFFTTQGDGGIYTSLRDYVKWLNGIRYQMGLFAEARRIQFMIDSSKKLGYGYGWFVGAAQQPEVVYHTGSNGGFRAIVVTIPSEDYALIIFSNRTGIDLEKLAVEINRIFNKENKSLQRIDSLISFNHSWPIFAPCKKTRRFLISSTKNWKDREMA